MEESRWSKMDKGNWDTFTLLCDECENKMPNPMVCKAYSDRKPTDILKGSRNCPKFIEKKPE